MLTVEAISSCSQSDKQGHMVKHNLACKISLLTVMHCSVAIATIRSIQETYIFHVKVKLDCTLLTGLLTLLKMISKQFYIPNTAG